MKPLDQEHWVYRLDRDGNAAVHVMSEDLPRIATVSLDLHDYDRTEIDMARVTLIVDAPALLRTLKWLYEIHVGMEPAYYPGQGVDDARELLKKYRAINRSLCSRKPN